jgi:hypothetical protein
MSHYDGGLERSWPDRLLKENANTPVIGAKIAGF